MLDILGWRYQMPNSGQLVLQNHYAQASFVHFSDKNTLKIGSCSPIRREVTVFDPNFCSVSGSA